MSIRISPLRLEGFDQLPKHARQCVFWEVDPQILGPGDQLADPEFEKEAWLSMVMLEWGSCGQVAVAETADDSADSDEPCRGFVLYAPPRAVPRAQRFPTSPVSPDAVLLTSIGVETDDIEGVEMLLIGHVVTELVRRGVRALEAFGRTAQTADILVADAVDPELTPVIASLGECSFDRCMIDADFLLSAGFTVVAPHQYFPRLRLELDKGLGWKADVEAALERLLQSTQLQPLTLR